MTGETECIDHDWMEFGGPGDEWRECFLCGLQEDNCNPAAEAS